MKRGALRVGDRVRTTRAGMYCPVGGTGITPPGSRGIVVQFLGVENDVETWLVCLDGLGAIRKVPHTALERDSGDA